MNVSSITAGFAHWPMDWIIIGLFFSIITILSLRSGTRAASALALTLPITVFVINASSGATFISLLLRQFSTGIAPAILFVVVFVALYLLVYRMTGSYGLTGAYPVQALLAGLAAAVIGVVFWLQIPALAGVWHFGPQVQAVFSESYRLLWLLGAYAALAFVRR